MLPFVSRLDFVHGVFGTHSEGGTVHQSYVVFILDHAQYKDKSTSRAMAIPHGEFWPDLPQQ